MIRIIENAAEQKIRFRPGNAGRLDVQESVSRIIADVRARGDEALRELSLRFDGACPEPFELEKGALKIAAESISPVLLQTLEEAAENIRRYHSAQIRKGFVLNGDGTMLMERIVPLESIGVYVPGGTAVYPSSVLMNVIPASLA